MSVCVGGGCDLFKSYQCVCVHALLLSVHGLSLCCVCASLVCSEVCAVGFVVEPAFAHAF